MANGCDLLIMIDLPYQPVLRATEHQRRMPLHQRQMPLCLAPFLGASFLDLGIHDCKFAQCPNDSRSIITSQVCWILCGESEHDVRLALAGLRGILPAHGGKMPLGSEENSKRKAAEAME
jgi:hypothetical protein